MSEIVPLPRDKPGNYVVELRESARNLFTRLKVDPLELAAVLAFTPVIKAVIDQTESLAKRMVLNYAALTHLQEKVGLPSWMETLGIPQNLVISSLLGLFGVEVPDVNNAENRQAEILRLKTEISTLQAEISKLQADLDKPENKTVWLRGTWEKQLRDDQAKLGEDQASLQYLQDALNKTPDQVAAQLQGQNVTLAIYTWLVSFALSYILIHNAGAIISAVKDLAGWIGPMLGVVGAVA